KILIGQPGRYFLPNIVPHLLFIVTGIGFLLHRKTRFILAMKILALATILLQLHAIVNVIIPRYYL
ncbi:MAG: Phospholipid carrier-dependent glycosyltransferase, partial [Patescibacteria group bacterium]|nr:Phospholipid carrier-dependent glycosyltransferase [Patescibacteria group bacterium]